MRKCVCALYAGYISARRDCISRITARSAVPQRDPHPPRRVTTPNKGAVAVMKGSTLELFDGICDVQGYAFRVVERAEEILLRAKLKSSFDHPRATGSTGFIPSGPLGRVEQYPEPRRPVLAMNGTVDASHGTIPTASRDQYPTATHHSVVDSVLLTPYGTPSHFC